MLCPIRRKQPPPPDLFSDRTRANTIAVGGACDPRRAPQGSTHPRWDRRGGSTGGPGVAGHLHLHGASSWFFGAAQVPSAYSHPSAPGLIVGSGNVAPAGEQGLDDNDAICTYVSSDGGATWADAAEGAWIYEYADWGGVIVMAKHEVTGAADEVRVSTDYGRCWRSARATGSSRPTWPAGAPRRRSRPRRGAAPRAPTPRRPGAWGGRACPCSCCTSSRTTC